MTASLPADSSNWENWKLPFSYGVEKKLKTKEGVIGLQFNLKEDGMDKWRPGVFAGDSRGLAVKPQNQMTLKPADRKIGAVLDVGSPDRTYSPSYEV